MNIIFLVFQFIGHMYNVMYTLRYNAYIQSGINTKTVCISCSAVCFMMAIIHKGAAAHIALSLHEMSQ